VENLFPGYRYTLVSSDEMANTKSAKQVIDKITNNEVDIIIGTQIITKGYHFAKLNFVGIVDGDIGFSNCDLRSFESTFQLLQQVSGRAGRQTAGQVMLQTWQDQNKVIDCVVESNYEKFIEHELLQRKESHMPPFSKIATIMVSAVSQKNALAFAKVILHNAAKMQGIKLLGPASPMLSRLKGRYRYNLLVICAKEINLQKYITQVLNNVKKPSSVTIKIDIDPYSII
jgi:primosomal protein N' (replication factor Y)